MEKIIHICFSPSAGGTLKHAIKKKKLFEGKKVIVFCDDISQGIIENDINIDERISWWNNINKEEEEKIHSTENDYLTEGYEKFYKKISKIKDSDVIYLWYGQCSQEICGMMYTLELLKDKLKDIYLINVSDMIYETANGVYTHRSVSEIMPEKLKSFIKLKRKIELDEYDILINEWNSLKNDNSLIRILKDGKVKSATENYFDIDILKFTETELKKSARIVGNVMGFSETRISDDYIFWRVQELVNLGMLEFKGKFGVMREMEIKITQKGIEYLSTDSEAMLFWENREAEMEIELAAINEAKKQGRMEEKISISKKLMDVLEIEVIAEKTELTVAQVKNLKIDKLVL